MFITSQMPIFFLSLPFVRRVRRLDDAPSLFAADPLAFLALSLSLSISVCLENAMSRAVFLCV